MAARRTTLGGVSNSNLNSRMSMGNLGRPSLGGNKSSLSRMSMGGAPMRASSMSIGHTAEGLSTTKQRRSTATRRSSAFGGKRANDPRPLMDKQFTNEAIGTVIEFLLSRNYDHRIDPSLLKRPTGRDFKDIVSFLFSQIDPHWNANLKAGKFEEEVINMFKTLKYPYSISKTSLSAVGSPHAWPQLLGALTWLVELLTYDAEVKATGGHRAGDFDQDDIAQEGDRLFVEYLGQAYRAFLSGDDDLFNELEHDFAQSFSATIDDLEGQTKVLSERQSTLVAEIDVEKAHGASLPEKKMKLATLKADLAKFSDFKNNLEAHKQALETKNKDRKEAVEAATAQLEETDKQVKLLHERVDSQELSAVDAERMVKERERLQVGLAEATEYHKEMRQLFFGEDMALSNKIEDLERALHSYTSHATALQLLPATAKNAQGRDFKITVDKEKFRTATCVADVLPKDPSAIKTQLSEFKGLISAQVSEAKAELLHLLDQQEASEEALSDATDALDTIRNRNARLEDQYKREKEGMEATLGERQREQEKMEGDLDELRLDGAAEIERRQREQHKVVAELRAEAEDQHQECETEYRRMHENILNALGQLADYKEHVQRRLAETSEYYQQREEAMASLVATDPRGEESPLEAEDAEKAADVDASEGVAGEVEA